MVETTLISNRIEVGYYKNTTFYSDCYKIQCDEAIYSHVTLLIYFLCGTVCSSVQLSFSGTQYL